MLSKWYRENWNWRESEEKTIYGEKAQNKWTSSDTRAAAATIAIAAEPEAHSGYHRGARREESER